VLPGARRFAELGLDAGEPIEELALVDRLPRTPRTDDGVAADE
jgi:hypothetical protein